jgi:hypothetical protein
MKSTSWRIVSHACRFKTILNNNIIAARENTNAKELKSQMQVCDAIIYADERIATQQLMQ